jgi:hypothetical protein
MLGRRPQKVGSAKGIDLVSCKRRGALDASHQCRVCAAPWRVGFFIYIEVSCVCTSHERLQYILSHIGGDCLLLGSGVLSLVIVIIGS